MEKLNKYLLEMETKIHYQDTINQQISKSNVGWHIEHTLLVINVIIEQLKKSNPLDYKWSFKLLRLLVFATKKIPRGRGKSPKVVIPKSYNEISLNLHLQHTKSYLMELESVNMDSYFEHPYFGHLKLRKTIKFLEIHTNHHLKIIDDILKNKI